MAANLSSNYEDEYDSSLSDINVTPLVDVVLVLLIVFMITVPAIVGAARVKVDLPETSAVAADSEVLPFNFILRQGESGEPVLYLNDKEIDEAGVRKLFEDRGVSAADQPVSLSADRRLPYGRVMKVVDLLESCGLEKLSLDTRHVEAR
jgi:biopolymer transport protein ExbD